MKSLPAYISNLLYRIEPKEFQWPFSAVYSWGARLMEPGYRYIAQETILPGNVERLLDIGGGDGRLAIAFARHHPDISEIYTVDISRDMSDRARKRAEKNGLQDRVHAEAEDVHILKYDNAYFDAIVSFASLHHWREPVKALRELDRVLKQNGTISIRDGYGRPSFKRVRNTVDTFGGSLWASMIYWIGTRDVLLFEEIVDIVRMCEIEYISAEYNDPVVIIKGTKAG